MTDDPLHFHHVACDLCGSEEKTRFLLPHLLPEGLPEAPLVVRCNGCGLLYTDPRPDEAGVTRLYRKHYDTGGGKPVGGRVQKLVRGFRLLRRLWHGYCGHYLGEVLDKVKGRVLDVGCGTGGLLDELRQAGCETCGVELNPDSVKTCLEKGLDVRCGDLSGMDFPDDMFDTVILWHSLEHLPSPREALAKIMHILKPGGKLFIYSPNAGSYLARYFAEDWWAWQVPFHFYHFTVATIRRLCGDLGYTIVKCGSKTPEFFLHKSIQARLTHGQPGRIFGLLPRAVYRTLMFRLSAAPVLRLLDLAMPDRGECLTVEVEKPGQ